ncbi:hypothetical protein BU14_0025s0076 [Porphyra umbilicalis]|uniref:Uncharacterized protein n=1 Tax=Porphyra umbilicalis TaxID=2786 RepID=A0A1X6PK76_PORUM|nr:hypothetical protein BU14_0025s0076 [Porphyra umbilicalis]|eukprot:OSX81195.1 hypothetical protein BU14_0025s0076 [Porphyra umbilicalis]
MASTSAAPAVGRRGGEWARVRGRQTHRCALAGGGAGRAEQRGTRQPERTQASGACRGARTVVTVLKNIVSPTKKF